MPRFGVCTGLENAAMLKAAGWDYVEGHVQRLLQGEMADADWHVATAIRAAALPVEAANCLVPAGLKITGPEADPARLQAYMERVIRRAAEVRIETLVLGSGAARRAPEGFSHDEARAQLIRFSRMAAEMAARRGVMIVLEPHNRKECNLINSVGDALACLRAVDHPNFMCLVDSWHFWLEDDTLDAVQAALPWVRHVHLADRAGRLAPGQSITEGCDGDAKKGSDYRGLFGVLKQAGYDGRISAEAAFQPDMASAAAGVLAFLRREWAAA